MNQIIPFLAGAPGAASQADSYYQQAINQAQGLGSGSLGKTIVSEQNAALQPQFRTQDQQLGASLASQGITNSGAAKAAYGNLAGNQSGVIAGADAPVFQTAEGVAGNLIGQVPGAETSAYQAAIQQFMQAASDAAAAAAGVPPVGQAQPDYNQNGIPGFSTSDVFNASGAPGSQYPTAVDAPVASIGSGIPAASWTNPYSATNTGGG